MALVSLGWDIWRWIHPEAQGPSYAAWMMDLGAISLLGTATFRIWHKEWTARFEAEQQLRRETPHFTLYINWMAFDDPKDGVCTAYFLISAENVGGKPSVLHMWRVAAHVPGQLEQAVDVWQPDSDEIVLLEGRRATLKVPAESFISFRAYPNPIEPGAGCRGLLRLRVPANLPDGRTRFVLRVQDVLKNVYECDYDTATRRQRSDDIGEIGGWPGVVMTMDRIHVAHGVLRDP